VHFFAVASMAMRQVLADHARGARREKRGGGRERVALDESRVEAPTADVVLGVEDLLIDRLRAWVHWKSDEDGRWAQRLAALYAERLDWAYLRSRAGEAGERTALVRLEAAR